MLAVQLEPVVTVAGKVPQVFEAMAKSPEIPKAVIVMLAVPIFEIVMVCDGLAGLPTACAGKVSKLGETCAIGVPPPPPAKQAL